MRKTLVALSLLVAPALFAQSADLQITSINLSNTPTHTGERFAMSLRWRNDGPDTAQFVTLTVSGTPSPYYVLNVATSGWPCYPNAEGTSFSCQNAELAPGAEAELVLQMISPPVAGTFTLHTNVQSHTADPRPANNSRDFSTILEASPTADLSLSPTSQLQRADAGAAVTVPVIVSNSGANPVDNLILYFSVPVSSAPPPFTLQGEGWSCGQLAYGPQAYVCTRPHLAAGEVAPITVSTHALANGSFTISGRVRGENHSDPTIANDTTTIVVQTGEDNAPPSESWSRVLIPLVGADIPGQSGSLWRTEVTAMITGDRQVNVRPLFCEFVTVCNAPVWLLNVPFNAYQQGLAGQVLPSAIGQFVYVPTADAARLHLNARVYDVSRAAETAGAEIPIPRENDFTHERVSLIGIPVAPQYRHTLRIYDLDGSTADVRINIYANNETVPRASIVRALIAPAQNFHTAAGLPVHPGVIQLDLQQLVATAGLSTLRVDIEPVDPATRLWSFVSLTNNNTHHVTTFSQH